VAKYLNKKQRNQLLENQIARNRENMIETLRKARRRVEMRMIEAARNERFATVRRIRDGIYKDIGEEYKRLQGDLDEWTQDSILRTSKVYHGIAAADLLATDEDKLASSFTKFSAKHNEQYFAKVHPFNAEKLAAVNVHLNPQLVRMAETDVRALRTATVDALREAHIAGMTPQERYRLLRGKVMDLAENPKSWQFIDRSGRKWKKNNYFDMLNRTVTANVARDTYHDALADEQRDLVQIIGGTSADSNEACVKFDGKIVSMTGATSGFPTLDEYISEGGFHPNCVHSTAYISKTYGPHQKLIEEQTGEAVVDEPKVVEFVPAKTMAEAEGRIVASGVDNVSLKGLTREKYNGVLAAVEASDMSGVKAIQTFAKPSAQGAAYFQPNGTLSINLSKTKKLKAGKGRVRPYRERLASLDDLAPEWERIKKAAAAAGDTKTVRKARGALSRINTSRRNIEADIKAGMPARIHVTTGQYDSVGDKMKSLTSHEIGHSHHLHHDASTYGPNYRPAWFDQKISVSEYGRSSAQEYYAEWFAQYKMQGSKDIPAEMLKLFKAGG